MVQISFNNNADKWKDYKHHDYEVKLSLYSQQSMNPSKKNPPKKQITKYNMIKHAH